MYVTRVCPWYGVLRDNEKVRFHVISCDKPVITTIIHQPRAQHHLSRNRPCPLQRLSITLVEDRSKVSDKGSVAESSLVLVLSKFEVFDHQETKTSSRRATRETDQERPEKAAKYHPFRKHRGECKIPATEPASRGRRAKKWRHPGRSPHKT